MDLNEISTTMIQSNKYWVLDNIRGCMDEKTPLMRKGNLQTSERDEGGGSLRHKGWSLLVALRKFNL